MAKPFWAKRLCISWE